MSQIKAVDVTERVKATIRSRYELSSYDAILGAGEVLLPERCYTYVPERFVEQIPKYPGGRCLWEQIGSAPNQREFRDCAIHLTSEFIQIARLYNATIIACDPMYLGQEVTFRRKAVPVIRDQYYFLDPASWTPSFILQMLDLTEAEFGGGLAAFSGKLSVNGEIVSTGGTIKLEAFLTTAYDGELIVMCVNE